MRKHVFKHLVSDLTQQFGLKPTQHIGINEAVAMFSYMIRHGAPYRDVEERFQHPGDTVQQVCNGGPTVVEITRPVSIRESNES
ncbi:hypothetical protein L6164_023673 [Bauhinia variegata]|uniref:Uncharacterized protein n=1 Tax=Bauhinia variegata TaxID=167791 RepID=A0ACB9MP30_BAUVA|nr:hypothetical protein L6164_023673 [Bauhinia variegata]